MLRASWLFGRLRVQAAALKERGDSLHAALAAQQELETDLRHQAFHDSLTGLANRALLRDRVEHALEASTRLDGNCGRCASATSTASRVSTTASATTSVIRSSCVASKRLAAIVRPGDTVARLGGDEFAILIENVEDFESVTSFAERIVSVLHEPAVIDGQEIYLSASVGVALAEVGTTTESLLSEADAAMYDAKATGKDKYTVFKTDMRSRVVDRMVDDQRLPGVAAPQRVLPRVPAAATPVRRRARGLRGAAALAAPDARVWSARTGSSRSPRRPASSSRSAAGCSNRPASKRRNGPRPDGTALTVSVNLSGRQLQDPNLLQDVRTALSFSGLEPAAARSRDHRERPHGRPGGHGERLAAVPRDGHPHRDRRLRDRATRR